MSGSTVAAVAVLTGWGQGIEALPADAAHAAAGRAVIPMGRPALESERFRRATRECLLGVAAVDALMREADLSREVVKGSSTALFYVTGAAYGASNQAFVVADALGQGQGSTLHFPYTAPSAMAGEVAIEFGLTGPYGILIGGPPATIDALWQATRLLASGRCERALVLAVETFEECAALYARGRWLVRRPLVEAAACALLVPGTMSARASEEYAAVGDQLPFLGGRSREQIEAVLAAHGLSNVGSDPLLDLVAAQAQRMVDEGRERRTHRRYVVWGDLAR